ncbi:MAG: carbamoyltransferase HypF [Mycobacterium sp.]
MTVCCRLRLEITGVVQGVGFRPTVARLATAHGLSGFVYNNTGAVYCELEGAPDVVDAAVSAIRTQAPPMARIDAITARAVDVRGGNGFHIVASSHGDDEGDDNDDGAGARTLIPPDIAICADCLREIHDPTDRRYQHPFITCTNCGPRYTVITDLPYDRPATTMAAFPMCAACAAEYHDPADRRFHAQTIACPDCGPVLSWTGSGAGTDPLSAAAVAIAGGKIVAVKGVGGYHLACRADDARVVGELRRRKKRPAKPFAVMVPDLAAAARIAVVDPAAADALSAPAAPIVLLPHRPGIIDPAVAPGLREVGVLLAYSPLHHLLFARLGSVPLVMTSANQGGSPIVFADEDLHQLEGLVDGVLGHDRPIHIPCEDSVLMMRAGGGAVPIRRSRGYAPLPLSVPAVAADAVILATGGDLKTTFCLMDTDGQAHMSAHLGDMADPRTQACFDSALAHLVSMTDRVPTAIACDLHPTYATTHWARRHQRDRGIAVRPVQHHHAHAVSLLAEHRRLTEPAMVVAYDGTGYGTDGTIWGGELLVLREPARFARVGHLKPFALPGGDGAVRQPARIALDLLHRAKIGWDEDLAPVAAVGPAGLHVLAQQIPRGVGCVTTSSMGRLFDAVSSLLGVCQQVSYEGQAAVELEHLACTGRAVPLEFDITAGVLDPAPVLAGLVGGLRAGRDTADLAAGFHEAVVRATVAAAGSCARAAGIDTIGLTGGVFVNRLLLEGIGNALTDNGFNVLTHAVLPCNDGGIALGQAVIAAQLGSNADDDGSGVCAWEFPAR